MSGAPGWLLAIDTATNTIVVAAGTPDGQVMATDAFGTRRSSCRRWSGSSQRRGSICGTSPA